MIKLLLLNISLCFILSGCHSSTVVSGNPAPGTADVEAVFTSVQSGGCVRIGENCAHHTLFSDGSVEAKRRFDGVVEARGSIDTGQLSSWLTTVNSTDFDALVSRLAEGICAGCFDGIDYTYTVYQNTNPTTLDSTLVLFDEAEPFFAMTAGVYQAILNAAPLPLNRYE